MGEEKMLTLGSYSQKSPKNVVQSHHRLGAFYLLSLLILVASSLTSAAEARESQILNKDQVTQMLRTNSEQNYFAVRQ
jgi:hypothetical protein